jgi:hypothetical protein
METFLQAIVAWVLVALTASVILRGILGAIATRQHMTRIPCPRCRYYTHKHYLKCPVHPGDSLTPAAIACRDFAPLGLT